MTSNKNVTTFLPEKEKMEDHQDANMEDSAPFDPETEVPADHCGREQNPYFEKFTRKDRNKKKIQQRAIEASDKRGRLPLFSLDMKRTSEAIPEGAKYSITSSYDAFWSHYLSEPPEERCFYEVLLKGMPSHLYLDLDMDKTMNPGVDAEHLCNVVTKEVELLLVELGACASEKEITRITLDSSNDEKLSKHYLFKLPEKKYFVNSYHCGAFFRRLRKRVLEKYGSKPEENPLYVWKKEKGRDNETKGQKITVRDFVVDLTVYTKRKVFRTNGSTKRVGGFRPLLLEGEKLTEHWVPKKKNFFDCLVQYVPPPYEYSLFHCKEEDGTEPISRIKPINNTKRKSSDDRPPPPPLDPNNNSTCQEDPVKRHCDQAMTTTVTFPPDSPLSKSFSFDTSTIRMHPNWKKEIQTLNYYRTTLPMDALFSLFGNTNREFAVEDVGGNMKRHLKFGSLRAFQNMIHTWLPSVIHLGPIESSSPSTKETALTKELVFDIDMDSYGNEGRRTCCGSEKKVCEKCWKYAKFCIRMLEGFLRDYGFDPKSVFFFFSGMKGIHCWVTDERARGLSKRARQSLLDDLDIRKVRVCGGDKRRAYAEEALRDSGGRGYYENCLRNDQGLGERLDRKINEKGKTEALLDFIWPEFDEPVTTGINHLTKMPFCLHSSTKNPAIYLRSYNVPDFHMLSDEGQIETSIRDFRCHVRELSEKKEEMY